MAACWWSYLGDFACDASGLYPRACQVVAAYRRISGLSRQALAEHLHLRSRMFYYTERDGCGLGSVARLRALQALLAIPPALLGLCAAPGPTGWWRTEYEPWPAGADDWPDAGAVVKFYRRAKSWTQSDLAAALGVTELAVRNMENTGSGLDSLTRRRALRFLLAVPPLLLGLDSEHLAREIGKTLVGVSNALSPELLASFRGAADALFTSYHVAHAQEKVGDALAWLSQVHECLTVVPGSQRSYLLEVESLGYQALANITREYAADGQVFSFANKAVQLARSSQNNDLLVVSLLRRAETLINRDAVDLAQRSMQEALLSSVEDEALRLHRFVSAARILAATAADEQERSAVFALLGQAQSVPAPVTDAFHLRGGVDFVTIYTALTYNLLAANAPQRLARDLYRRISDLLLNPTRTPGSARGELSLTLAQAQAFVGLSELDYAAQFAVESLPLMDQLQSVLYLPRLAALYATLQKSTLHADPQVARLGLYLHGHGAL